MLSLLVLLLTVTFQQNNSSAPSNQSNNAEKQEQQSITQEVPIKNNYSGATNNPNNDPPESKSSMVIATSTVLYTVVTALLLGAVITQILAYWAKERAWMIMSIGNGNARSIDENGRQFLEFTGDIKNYGQSPAIITKTEHSASIIKREEQLPTHPQYLARPEVSYFAPDPIVPQGGSPVYWKITKEAMAEICTGQRNLYIFGRVIYKDIFGRNRETRYCFRYFPAIPGTHDRHVGFFPDGPPDYHKLT